MNDLTLYGLIASIVFASLTLALAVLAVRNDYDFQGGAFKLQKRREKKSED